MRNFLAKGQKAFTLPEIIISISVMVMVITAATGILVSVIRSNSDNMESLIAYGLAQEGIEAFRNIRDSNWTLGLNFNGSQPSSSTQNNPIWSSFLFTPNESVGSKKYFALHQRDEIELQACSDQDISSCAPWQLLPLSLSDSSLKLDSNNKIDLNSFAQADLEKITVFKKHIDPSQNSLLVGSLLYNQFSAFNSAGHFEKSPFQRFIEVEKLCFDKLNGPNCQSNQLENLRLRISSGVFWTTANGVKNQIILTTELTDWKND